MTTTVTRETLSLAVATVNTVVDQQSAMAAANVHTLAEFGVEVDTRWAAELAVLSWAFGQTETVLNGALQAKALLALVEKGEVEVTD